MTTTEINPARWHAQNIDQVCTDLDADPVQGLHTNDAARRLERHGPNRLM